MKFGVGILAYNCLSHFRVDLLEQTIETAREAFPTAELIVLDNGSDDGTEEIVARMPNGISYRPTDGNTSPGRGMNMIAAELLSRKCDVLVHSDDDMHWKPGAQNKLRVIFESNAASELVLVSGYLEPCWSWNTPRHTVDCKWNDQSVRVLVRDSAPACAWAYMDSDHGLFFPLAERFGQDVDACQRIRDRGLQVGQLDLAEHRGREFSTWGNRAHLGARPLDRVKWGV